MAKQISRSLLVGISLFMSACNYDILRSSNRQNPIEKKSAVDFDVVRTKIFETSCVSCHANYGSYDGVRGELDAIVAAVSSGRMPKGRSPLSPELKALLVEWSDNGAPRSGKSNEPREPDVLEATWASLSKRVFFPRCTVCHNPNGQARFLDLSSRNAIFNARRMTSASGTQLLDFENPDASYLLEVLKDDEEPMPPASSGLPRLTPDELSVLKEWIAYGLP